MVVHYGASSDLTQTVERVPNTPLRELKQRRRRRKFPFHKLSLPFLRHLENCWPAIESVSIKKKENRNPERTRTFRILLANLSP